MAPRRDKRRLFSWLAGVMFAALMVGSFIWFVHVMMSAKGKKSQRVVQTIQVIRPPPPPPPDQPPPPPPEKAAEPLPKDEPEPTPDQPADQPLGIDAEGSAGGDAFGLAARRGGADLLGSGNAPFAWYTNRMRDEIKDRLAAAACAKSEKGSLSTRIWVTTEGRVRQIKLLSTTGNSRIDACVEKTLESIGSLGSAPPPGMPEVVNLKVVF
jgi:periplasmic protein TonB